MTSSERDQKWQELQDHIENVFGRLLRGDVQRIEYKPQFSAPLLEVPSRYGKSKSA